jgi:hypothetical protein
MPLVIQSGKESSGNRPETESATATTGNRSEMESATVGVGGGVAAKVVAGLGSCSQRLCRVC